MKWLKAVKCSVMAENKTLGGEHAILYTDIKLECCTPETYIMLLINVISNSLKCQALDSNRCTELLLVQDMPCFWEVFTSK